MKKSRVLAGAFLAGGLWSSAAFAQAPPPAAAAPNPAAALGADTTPAAKPGICERIDKALDRKRRKCCQIPLGQMLNSITKPLSAATGGIIPGFCPAKPSDEDLKKPGAEGAAANLMKDAVEAQARRRAVRIMATFDCHWNPEAEAGLAAALRTDRAECVRLEAAIGLNRGCCCTRLIVEALEDCVSGMDKLGPSENSPRVQMFAQMALERCLCCPEATTIIEEAPPVDDKIKEKVPGEEVPVPKPVLLTPGTTAAPKKGSGKPSRELLMQAKKTLAAAQARQARNPLPEESLPAGQRSVAGIANYVVSGGSKPAAPQTAVPPIAAPKTSSPAIAQAPMKIMTPVVAEAPAALRPVPTAEPVSKIDPKLMHALQTLHDAKDPDARHIAAKTLASCNWREHPEAISGLLYTARNDKHAGVRVACIRFLAAMKAGTPEVITGLKPLTTDADEWIRQESTQALSALKAYLPPQTASIQ
jgi:hypothetical protein